MHRLADSALTRDAMLALAGILYVLGFIAGVMVALGRLTY